MATWCPFYGPRCFYEDELESPEVLEHAPAHAAPLSVTSGRQKMGRKKAGRAGFSCPECLTGQAGEPEGYGWFPGTVTEGESSELQCQRSDKKSKCCRQVGLCCSYSFVHHSANTCYCFGDREYRNEHYGLIFCPHGTCILRAGRQAINKTVNEKLKS